MEKGRLEAFSDGVIAIIITIMVLEFKVPHGGNLSDLLPLLPTFSTYIISFIYVGIYWNNHHHMFSVVEKINGKALWANLHLLFWLSIIPLVTAWMGENNFSKWPVILYGLVLLMNGLAYYILSLALLSISSQNSKLAQALGEDYKGKWSLVIYIIGVGMGFINPSISLAMYILVACIWFIPDRRIEKTINPEL